MPQKKTKAEADILDELLHDSPPEAAHAATEPPHVDSNEPEALETPDHASRAQNVVATLSAIEVERLDYVDSGRPFPQDGLLDRLEDLAIALADQPAEPWPPSSWGFLVLATRVCHEIDGRGSNWRSPVTPWPLSIWHALQEMHDCIPTLLDPPPPPSPRIVELESLAELIEQKVNASNIAAIYGWALPNGKPDIQRVRKAKKPNGEAPPTTHTYPAASSGPRRQPSLVIVDSLAQRFEAEKSPEKEPMMI